MIAHPARGVNRKIQRDGIACAGEQKKPIKAIGVRPLPDHRLWVRFSTGKIKVFDCKPLLEAPAFEPLKDAEIWSGVYIDYGVTVRMDGDIDIAPEYLFIEKQHEKSTKFSTGTRSVSMINSVPIHFVSQEQRQVHVAAHPVIIPDGAEIVPVSEKLPFL